MSKKETKVADVLKKKVASVMKIVAVNTLKFFENNPKKFTSKQFGRLLRNVKSEGIIQPLTVNKRTMTVLDGNQRLKVAMQLGIQEVEVQFIDIEPADEGKFIAYFNKTRADYDDDAFRALLKKYENDDFIKELLSDYEEKVDKLMSGATSEYEIVSEVDETYNYVVFVNKKAVDHLNVETFFNMGRVYDPHKSKLIGMGRVISGDALNRLINLAVAQGYKNINEL